jgi:DNA-binding IclR family transcriptional regulator
MITIAEDLLNRAKEEFREMPGLLLTTRQASRLWNLDASVCQSLLSTLVHEKFLSQTHAGGYLRRGGCSVALSGSRVSS